MDLFVRVSNKIAISMYTQLGYIVYRTILEYYSGDPDEDAYGKSFYSLLFYTAPFSWERRLRIVNIRFFLVLKHVDSPPPKI